MNWEQLKWWVNLVPRKQIIAGLAIILVVLCTVVSTLFGIILSTKNETIEDYKVRMEAKEKESAKKDDEIAKCQQESLTRARQDLELERERYRKADSMNFALRAAEAALKKAAKHGN